MAQRHTWQGRQRKDGGKDWRDVATSQGVTRQKPKEAKKNSALGPVEGARPATTVTADSWPPEL